MDRTTRNKKEMNKGPIILIGIIVVLIAGFFGVRAYQTSQVKKQGEETIQAFVKHLQKGNYQELPKSLNADSMKNSGYSKKQVVEKYQSIFSGISASNIKLKNLTVDKQEMIFIFLMLYQ